MLNVCDILLFNHLLKYFEGNACTHKHTHAHMCRLKFCTPYHWHTKTRQLSSFQYWIQSHTHMNKYTYTLTHSDLWRLILSVLYIYSQWHLWAHYLPKRTHTCTHMHIYARINSSFTVRMAAQTHEHIDYLPFKKWTCTQTHTLKTHTHKKTYTHMHIFNHWWRLILSLYNTHTHITQMHMNI